jgi:hypothetical protein
VETLLDHAADRDVAEAEAAIERLAAAPAEEGLVIREIWLLRLRTLLARAHGDDVAESLGFEGHIAFAEAMSRMRSRQFDHPRGRASPCRDGPVRDALGVVRAHVVAAVGSYCAARAADRSASLSA